MKIKSFLKNTALTSIITASAFASAPDGTLTTRKALYNPAEYAIEKLPSYELQQSKTINSGIVTQPAFKEDEQLLIDPSKMEYKGF